MLSKHFAALRRFSSSVFLLLAESWLTGQLVTLGDYNGFLRKWGPNCFFGARFKSENKGGYPVLRQKHLYFVVDSFIKMFCVSTFVRMMLSQFTAVSRPLFTDFWPRYLDSMKANKRWHGGWPRRVTCPKDGEDETLMKHDQTDGLNHHLVVKTKTHYKWFVVWICLYFSIYWEYSSQLANIFQRGWNHQPYIIFYGKVISWMDWCSINAGRITSGFRSDVCCLSPVFVCWLLLLETTIAPLASGEKKTICRPWLLIVSA